jgi:hypothetical protein
MSLKGTGPDPANSHKKDWADSIHLVKPSESNSEL